MSVTTVGTLLTDWTNDTLFGEWITPGAQSALESIVCASWLTGLLVDGIISGVGAVLGFVPHMLVLFIFLAFLESCGYESGDTDFLLKQLSGRLCLEQDYPHEIGLFLGYPLADVVGFIENRGWNYTC